MVAAGQCVDWYWLETKAIPPPIRSGGLCAGCVRFFRCCGDPNGGLVASLVVARLERRLFAGHAGNVVVSTEKIDTDHERMFLTIAYELILRLWNLFWPSNVQAAFADAETEPAPANSVWPRLASDVSRCQTGQDAMPASRSGERVQFR
jgi:hypothetical protein